jgi:hypothetical protein
MEQARVNRAKAIFGLEGNDNDIVESIMVFSFKLNLGIDNVSHATTAKNSFK